MRDYIFNKYVPKAQEAIRQVLLNQHPLAISSSYGKDSTCSLNLVLQVAQEMTKQGHSLPPIIISHADPLVENPAMARHAKEEMARIREFVAAEGLQVEIRVATPNLLAQWPVRVIGGKALPVFAMKKERDCTKDLKIAPQNRLRKAVLKELAGQGKAPVTVLGTRFEESSNRKARMEGRGENGDGVWINSDGELMLSPIADWTTAEVWTYLNACAAGESFAYGDFKGLIDLYLDGATEIETAENGCQVPVCRFGCSVCTVGRDKSMEALLANRPEKYGYMAGLLRLQKFLVNTQYDLGRRQWLGRSVTDDGCVAIAPDVYSPQMLQDLLRYCLTLDVKEKEAACRLGIDPRFEIISMQVLIAIDAYWSLNGYLPAFRALAIYKDVYLDGNRYEIPEIAPTPRVTIPKPKYLSVGKEWWEDYEWAGLYDPLLDAFGEGCVEHATLTNGRKVLGVRKDLSFDVDLESAHLTLELELDSLLERHRNPLTARTAAFHWYVQTGILNIAKGKHASELDFILRRTLMKQRQGLFDATPERLLALAEEKEDTKKGVVIHLPQNTLSESDNKEVKTEPFLQLAFGF